MFNGDVPKCWYFGLGLCVVMIYLFSQGPMFCQLPWSMYLRKGNTSMLSTTWLWWSKFSRSGSKYGHTVCLGEPQLDPSSSAEQNPLLISHIQRNIEAFLNSSPDGLAIVCGDFNPPSTRIKSVDVTMATDLRQILKFPTRNDAILDWCLVNKPNLLSNPVQLPKIGTSDLVITMHSWSVLWATSIPPTKWDLIVFWYGTSGEVG